MASSPQGPLSNSTMESMSSCDKSMATMLDSNHCLESALAATLSSGSSGTKRSGAKDASTSASNASKNEAKLRDDSRTCASRTYAEASDPLPSFVMTGLPQRAPQWCWQATSSNKASRSSSNPRCSLATMQKLAIKLSMVSRDTFQDASANATFKRASWPSPKGNSTLTFRSLRPGPELQKTLH